MLVTDKPVGLGSELRAAISYRSLGCSFTAPTGNEMYARAIYRYDVLRRRLFFMAWITLVAQKMLRAYAVAVCSLTISVHIRSS